MTIRAVIFDLGGVILRTEDQTPRRKWEARLGLQPGDLARAVFDCDASARATIGELDSDAIWESVGKRFALAASDLNTLRHDFFAGDAVDHALVQFIRDLRPRYKTAILSNAWLQLRAELTDRLFLGDAVDEIIISAEEKIAKPDARIYQLAAKRLQVQPHEAIFVDDLLINTQAASATGMRGVHFDRRKYPTTEEFIRHLSTQF